MCLHRTNVSVKSPCSVSDSACLRPGSQVKQELYGAHNLCAASQLHTTRELLICFVYAYEYVGVTCVSKGHTITTTFNFAGREGPAVVVISQPVCVFCLLCIRYTFD